MNAEKRGLKKTIVLPTKPLPGWQGLFFILLYFRISRLVIFGKTKVPLLATAAALFNLAVQAYFAATY